MVIVRLIGGMANQMFPYATARHLAHILNAELKLDITGFKVYRERQGLDFRRYALDVFSIKEEFATPREIELLTTRDKNLLEKVLKRKAGRPKNYVKEKHFHFDPKIFDLKGDIYLDGNWNSPRYFESIASILQKEFTIHKTPTGKNMELLKVIDVVTSVSIHVRRGDYVSNPKVNAVHGCCSLDYYRTAVDLIKQKVDNPHFFIFSDDPQWVRENLRLDGPATFVDHNGPLEGHEDMRLMSRCQHNIIANSGFSWWAAWLNTNRNKIVCAPQRWFVTEKYDTSTLIPAEWHKF